MDHHQIQLLTGFGGSPGGGGGKEVTAETCTMEIQNESHFNLSPICKLHLTFLLVDNLMQNFNIHKLVLF